MDKWQRVLTGTDRYGRSIDTAWLDGESITSAVVTCPAEVTCQDVTITGNVIDFELTKVGAVGRYTIYIDIQTPTRSDRYEQQITLADAQK